MEPALQKSLVVTAESTTRILVYRRFA